MTIFIFVLMLDPSRAMPPRLSPPPPAWSAKKVDVLKKIDFGVAAASAAPDFDPVTLKVRDLLPVDFDRL